MRQGVAAPGPRMEGTPGGAVCQLMARGRRVPGGGARTRRGAGIADSGMGFGDRRSLSHIHAAGWVHGRVKVESMWISENRAVLGDAGQSRTGPRQAGRFSAVRRGAARHGSSLDLREPGAGGAVGGGTRRYCQSASANGIVRRGHEEDCHGSAASAVRSGRPEAGFTGKAHGYESAKMPLLFRVVPPQPVGDARKRRRIAFWKLYWMIVAPACVVTAAGAALCYILR